MISTIKKHTLFYPLMILFYLQKKNRILALILFPYEFAFTTFLKFFIFNLFHIVVCCFSKHQHWASFHYIKCWLGGPTNIVLFHPYHQNKSFIYALVKLHHRSIVSNYLYRSSLIPRIIWLSSIIFWCKFGTNNHERGT